MTKPKVAKRTSVMVHLSCGEWMRSTDALVNLEEWNREHPNLPAGVAFGMGAKPGEFCQKHRDWERTVEVSFFEWHVFCYGDAHNEDGSRCGYNGWHGMDAEKARKDYERHNTLWPNHRLVVGWDGFTGSQLEQGSQGQLFVHESVDVERKRQKDAALEAVKRASRPRPRDDNPRGFPVDTPSQKVSATTLGDWNP